MRDHSFHSSQLTSQKTEIEGKWRELEIIYFKSFMISLCFEGGENDVAPRSNNLKVHSFSNISIFLWKTGTNREAGLGQPQYWKLMHHSTVSLHTKEGAELWQASYIFPPFYIYSVQFNCNCSHFTANKEKYWIKSAQFPINGTCWLITLQSALRFTLTEFYLTDTQNKCGFFFHPIKQSSASH